MVKKWVPIKLPICEKLLLEAILRHSPFYIIVINKILRILFLNRVHNGHPSEFIGGHVTKDAHPEDADNFINSCKDAFLKRETIRYDCRSKNGQQYTGKIIPIDKLAVLILWESHHRPLLTKREREINKMTQEGMTSKEIANALNLSPQTVNTHRKRINSKLKPPLVKNTNH